MQNIWKKNPHPPIKCVIFTCLEIIKSKRIQSVGELGHEEYREPVRFRTALYSSGPNRLQLQQLLVWNAIARKDH